MDIQCEPPSVCESAMKMKVQVFRTGVKVINHRGRHQGKNLRHAAYRESARCKFCVLKSFVNLREKFITTTVIFEVQQASDRSGYGRINCIMTLVLPFSGSDVRAS